MKLYAVIRPDPRRVVEETFVPSFSDGKEIGSVRVYFIGNTQVFYELGILRAEQPICGPLSSDLEGMIAGFNVTVTVSGNLRAPGMYHLPSDSGRIGSETTGVVEVVDDKRYTVTCYGLSREKVLELHNLIRTGNIRPIDEWDKEQIPGGPAELKNVSELLHIAKKEIAYLRSQLLIEAPTKA